MGVALLTTAITCAEPARQAQPSPSQDTITFTLTNSDCASDGLSRVLQPAFVFELVNTTSSRAAFNLQRLLDGRDYLELQLFIQKRQQAIAAGNDVPGVPPMVVHAAGVFVEAGQRGKLGGAISSGTYGLVCRRDDPVGQTEAIYVNGPFQVD
jgi:hypothetical protein